MWGHPPGLALDGKEFAKRVVGMVVLPYVGTAAGADPEAKELWGIARVIDPDAARLMRDEDLSTSPAVVLGKDDNERVPAGDGKHLLIEGNPAFVDHVAVGVERGVWDGVAGENGLGIDNGNLQPPEEEAGSTAGDKGESDMAEEKTKEEMEREEAEKKEADAKRRDDKRADHEGEPGDHEEPDKMLEGIKAVVADAMRSVHDRMDRMDARMDAADRARDDARRRDDDDRRDDAKKRDDEDDPDKEREQAATLEKVAAEEEQEAAEMEKEADACKADARPHWAAKRADEEEEEHSERVDRFAKRAKADRFARRDGEECMDHSKRADAMARRHDVRRDDSAFRPRKRDDARRDDARRDDDRRDDRHRDDRRARDDDSKRDDRHKDDARRDDDDARRRADAARDEELARLRRMVGDQERAISSLRRGPSDGDRRALAEIQERADAVLVMHNDHAPPYMAGETPDAYRVRMARRLQPYSQKWKDEDLDKLSRLSPTAYANVEGMIYADAATAAREPSATDAWELRPVRRPTGTGHQVTEWRGNNAVWLAPHMHVGATAAHFGRPKN